MAYYKPPQFLIGQRLKGHASEQAKLASMLEVFKGLYQKAKQQMTDWFWLSEKRKNGS